jgi:hypothetical protein
VLGKKRDWEELERHLLKELTLKAKTMKISCRFKEKKEDVDGFYAVQRQTWNKS